MSTTETLDLFGRSERQASWRFTLTDQAGDVLGELPVDRDSPPTVAVDTSRGVKRTLQRVNLPPGEVTHVDLIRDRLRLEMLLDDGSVRPMGWYLFTASTHEALSGPLLTSHENHAAQLDLVDQLLILDQDTDRSYTAGPATTLTTFLVEQVLAGLPVTIQVDSSGQQVGPEAIVWPAGTNRLRIVNEVAAMLGYHELYFDNTGLGRLGLMPDPMTTDPSDVLNYSQTPRVYRSSFTFSDDLLDLPNHFVVIGSGASELPVVGRYSLPASAPHSAANRGFRVTHVERMQGVETTLQAILFAIGLSRQPQFAAETIDFSGPPDPRHDHYNTLELEGVRFLEMGWSMILQEGAPMRHTARRTYEVTEE